jgi:hypothetical protein
MFKRFRPFNFVAFVVMYFFLLRYTYLINYAIDEGNKVTKPERMTASIFYVIRYPACLIWQTFHSDREIILALVINCLFYGLLLERLWYFLTGRWWTPRGGSRS